MPVRVGLRFIESWKSNLEKAVCKYETETEDQAPKGQIVFYGPSYYTRWCADFGMKPLREALPGKSGAPCCINRGFGSSCSEHQLYYYPRMVRPFEPKVLVYASHANGASFGYSQEEIWEIAQKVIMYTLTDFPDCRVYIVGAHPTKNMSDAERERKKLYDSWIIEFAEKTPNCSYINLLDHEPFCDPSVFLDDGVHFNRKGYDLCEEFYKEALKDELEKF